MKRVLTVLMFSAAFLSACKKGQDDKGAVFKGPSMNFQQGKAWTWIALDHSGKPEQLAIAIDDAAMNSLDSGDGPEGGYNPFDELSLSFHPKAAVTPFKHALLEWNPHGHEPAGIYDVPHFDFHFYMTSEADRLAIPPYQVDSSGFQEFPAPGYMPVTYIPTPGGVPQMGKHWVDINTPELNGQPFTQTFLYGTYAGKNTFYEPMITRDFLDHHISFERSFPVPDKFAESGYYPTKVKIVHEYGITNIILEGFVYRQAS